MFKYLGELIKNWLIGLGVSEGIAQTLTGYTGLLFLLIIAIISYFIAKQVIVYFAAVLVAKSKIKWDDAFARKRVFHRLAYLVPAIIINLLTPLMIPGLDLAITVIKVVIGIYMIVISLSVIFSALNGIGEIYQEFSISKTHPIKGYLQIVKIILIVIGVILVISILINKKPTALLVGLGTISAVLMLIFKDSILGFVGGLQLTANNMVRIGDWITMPKFGADGTVIDITLTTVKVQNWDKTITTLPTYSMVTDYFQNWRGMEESGGRRIKRSVNIDMTSVKFCDREMLDRFRKIRFVSEYVDKKDKEIEEYNIKNNIDNTVLVNGRRQTNLGIFRAYLKQYLRNKHEVNQKMTFLVRQLQPTEAGIPVEIYVFSKIKEWAKYEDIQSDIFDHVLAVIPHFDLRVFQNPSGSDFRQFTTGSPAQIR